MMIVVTILFSVSQRSNTLRFIPAEGKANGPLHHDGSLWPPLRLVHARPSRMYVVSINMSVQVEL